MTSQTTAVEDELRAALDVAHRHREWGYFGWMGKGDWVSRRIGRPGCRTCALLGRELHTEHGGLNGIWPNVCLAWSDADWDD